MIKYSLVLFLGTLAFAKIASPHEDSYSLPVWLYYLSAGIELAIGVLLVLNRVKLACLAGIAFFGAGTLLTMMVDGNCGCMGALLSMENRMLRLLVAGAGGAACAVLLHKELNVGHWRQTES